MKLTKSLGRLKTIKERRKEWESVNKDAEQKLEGGEVKVANKFAGLDDALEGEVQIIETERKVGEIGEEMAGLMVRRPAAEEEGVDEEVKEVASEQPKVQEEEVIE